MTHLSPQENEMVGSNLPSMSRHDRANASLSKIGSRAGYVAEETVVTCEGQDCGIGGRG